MKVMEASVILSSEAAELNPVKFRKVFMFESAIFTKFKVIL
jgi:hypothetical protein